MLHQAGHPAWPLPVCKQRANAAGKLAACRHKAPAGAVYRGPYPFAQAGATQLHSPCRYPGRALCRFYASPHAATSACLPGAEDWPRCLLFFPASSVTAGERTQAGAGRLPEPLHNALPQSQCSSCSRLYPACCMPVSRSSEFLKAEAACVFCAAGAFEKALRRPWLFLFVTIWLDCQRRCLQQAKPAERCCPIAKPGK